MASSPWFSLAPRAREVPFPSGRDGRHHGYMAWYSVRCVLRHHGDERLFEERITLWNASSFDEAIRRAEADAAEYGGLVNADYLGLAQGFELAEDSPGDGAEVFSLMRESDLAVGAYLDTFFDTGTERQQHS